VCGQTAGVGENTNNGKSDSRCHLPYRIIERQKGIACAMIAYDTMMLCVEKSLECAG